MSRLSYSTNTESHDFVFDTIGSLMRIWSKKQPQKPALVVYRTDTEREVISFGALYEKAERLAKYFVSIGIGKGDKVALFVHNSTEWFISSLACSLVGALSINSHSFDAEAGFSLFRGLGCKVLIADVRDGKVQTLLLNDAKSHEEVCTVVVIQEELKSKQTCDIGTDFHWILSTTSNDHRQLPSYIDPEDSTITFQTSGSTGIPKLVLHSHAGWLNMAKRLWKSMELTTDDIFFSDRPLGYAAGYPTPVILLGCTFVTLCSRSSVRDRLVKHVCQIMKTEGVTSGYVPPYLVIDLQKLKRVSPADVPYFKSIITSGQRVSKKLLDELKEFSLKAFTGYGATELGWTTFSSIDTLPKLNDSPIGVPLPGTEIKVVDEKGDIVPPLEDGEICVRTVATIKNYMYPDGTLKKATDDNGWFHTEDIGYMLHDGKNFFIKGRKVEMIKRSTVKLFPASAETVLSKHPALAEIAVVGIPDERLYQEVCACVTAKAGNDVTEPELREFSNEEFRPDLSHDGFGLMPGYFLIFDSFPRLTSNKIDRRKIAEMAEKLIKERGL